MISDSIFSLEYYKILTTIVRWLRTFEKMYAYIVILFYIKFKAMTAIKRNVLQECLSMCIYFFKCVSFSVHKSVILLPFCGTSI